MWHGTNLTLFASCLVLISANSQVKQLHIFFRHGERTPTETYKNDPFADFNWPQGWGSLTNRGKFELYSLGKKLRNDYSEVIPEYYSPNEVKISSSYSDRCLMSAQSLLAGLFPPKNEQIWNKDLLWQPIPVHYTPRNQDNLIAMKAACEKYDKELESVRESPEIVKINKENEELFRFLTENTGEKVDNVLKVEFLYNTLEIELLHNFSLPKWTEKVSFENLKNLAARSLALFTETEYMKRMKGGVFLNQTISLMKNKDKNPFIFLYSGHDISIVNIMRALGYEKLLKPGFGASLILELHQNDKIKMYYRHDSQSEGEEITVKDCLPDCTLQQIETALKSVLPQNWPEECKL